MTYIVINVYYSTLQDMCTNYFKVNTCMLIVQSNEHSWLSMEQSKNCLMTSSIFGQFWFASTVIMTSSFGRWQYQQPSTEYTKVQLD